MSDSKKMYWARRSRELPFNTKAHRKWGKEAEWIHGEGPYASLCYCPSSGSYGNDCLTIQLYDSLAEALQAQHNLCCGGRCQDNEANKTSRHQIWDLSSRGFRRVDKALYYDAAGNLRVEESANAND